MILEQIIAIMTVLFLVYAYGISMVIADSEDRVYFSIMFPLGIVGVILGGVIV